MPDIIIAATPEEAGEKLEQWLAEITQQVEAISYKPAFQDQVIQVLQAQHEEYFNAQSGPDGPWPALAASTVKAKGFDTILVEFNNMRSSLLFEGGDHVQDVEDKYLTWGTADEKAAIHQEGTSKIPQRAFVGVNDKNAEDIAEIIAEFTIQALD